MPRHNAQESSDRAALLFPPDLSPTGADGVFVPNNGVITLSLNRIPAEKTRLKGFSTNEHHRSHGKAVFRVWKKP